MKWLKRQLRNWLNSDDEIGMEAIQSPKRNRGLVSATSNDFDADNGLNIQVHKAHGGKIVSFRHYDRKTDRTNNSVYIITDEQEFERELGKMITLESMRG